MDYKELFETEIKTTTLLSYTEGERFKTLVHITNSNNETLTGALTYKEAYLYVQGYKQAYNEVLKFLQNYESNECNTNQ